MLSNVIVARLVVNSLQEYLDWLWDKGSTSDAHWEAYEDLKGYASVVADDPQKILSEFREVCDRFSEIDDAQLCDRLAVAARKLVPACRDFSDLCVLLGRGLLASSIEQSVELLEAAQAISETFISDCSAVISLLRSDAELPDFVFDLAEDLAELCDRFVEASEYADAEDCDEDEDEDDEEDGDESRSESDPFGLMVGISFVPAEPESFANGEYRGIEETLTDCDEIEAIGDDVQSDALWLISVYQPGTAD